MTEQQIVDLFLGIASKQDALWAIFVTVLMAIFGGIIYVDRPLKRAEKLFAIIAYLIFAMMNFVSLRAGQRLMDTLRQDLSDLRADQGSLTQTASLIEVSSVMIQFQQNITFFVHVFAAVIVVGAIVFDGKLQNRNTTGVIP